MEPRALANLNGSVIAASTSTTPKRSVSFEFSPTKSLLETGPAEEEISMADTTLPPPATPITPGTAAGGGPSTWGSPTTPYFLSKGVELIQQTCPPKQTMQGLFPMSGNIEDEPDEETRRRLVTARRKSLQWAPKIGSPLGRAVSYGK